VQGTGTSSPSLLLVKSVPYIPRNRNYETEHTVNMLLRAICAGGLAARAAKHQRARFTRER